MTGRLGKQALENTTGERKRSPNLPGQTFRVFGGRQKGQQTTAQAGNPIKKGEGGKYGQMRGGDQRGASADRGGESPGYSRDTPKADRKLHGEKGPFEERKKEKGTKVNRFHGEKPGRRSSLCTRITMGTKKRKRNV